MRPPWDFAYQPLSRSDVVEAAERDLVASMAHPAAPLLLEQALARAGHDARVEVLLERAPFHWYRVRTEAPVSAAQVSDALSPLGVRYVTSSRRPSPRVSAPLPSLPPGVPDAGWKPRQRSGSSEDCSGGRWFLDDATGVAVDRAVCGTGEGTRLAVIDDDARDAEALHLDAEVLVGVGAPPRTWNHGSVMVALAAGTIGDARRGIPAFAGVAPDTSPRLYCIPKAGQELFWLPLALIRAVDDGADVVVCATYVEGTTSPLLDDALELAARSGRQGRGTVVVLPTGREISSPPGSAHASLSLALDDPASDPRVLCVAPSGRGGGWFLYRDRLGLLRPFANRGPAVRVAAPGDDMAYPFATDGRMGHAESSGASAIAAGVAALVLAANPDLSSSELCTLLCRTAVRTGEMRQGPLGDPADVLPSGRDPDGHEAKTGHGRLSARRACLAARDPLLATLIALDEEQAARRMDAVLRRSRAQGSSPYSPELARSAARALLSDGALEHELAVVIRHVRLLVGRPERISASSPSALVRALALSLRRFLRITPAAPEDANGLLTELLQACESAEKAQRLGSAILAAADAAWPDERADGVSSAPRAGDLRRSA